jgi:hypothetical protein
MHYLDAEIGMKFRGQFVGQLGTVRLLDFQLIATEFSGFVPKVFHHYSTQL